MSVPSKCLVIPQNTSHVITGDFKAVGQEMFELFQRKMLNTDGSNLCQSIHIISRQKSHTNPQCLSLLSIKEKKRETFCLLLPHTNQQLREIIIWTGRQRSPLSNRPNYPNCFPFKIRRAAYLISSYISQFWILFTSYLYDDTTSVLLLVESTRWRLTEVSPQHHPKTFKS